MVVTARLVVYLRNKRARESELSALIDKRIQAAEIEKVRIQAAEIEKANAPAVIEPLVPPKPQKPIPKLLKVITDFAYPSSGCYLMQFKKGDAIDNPIIVRELWEGGRYPVYDPAQGEPDFQTCPKCFTKLIDYAPSDKPMFRPERDLGVVCIGSQLLTLNRDKLLSDMVLVNSLLEMRLPDQPVVVPISDGKDFFCCTQCSNVFFAADKPQKCSLAGPIK
jgi:hypothetical protein